jgi:hypothetical protein
MKKLFILSLGLLAILMSQFSNAAMIDVRQGGHLLGQIKAYSGTETGVANYNYHHAENHILQGPSLTAQAGHVFFYEGADGFFFNTVLGSVGKASPRGTVKWDIAVTNSDTNTYVAVSDDRGELKQTSSNNFTSTWYYIQKYGDGGVIGGLSGDWTVTVDPLSYINLVGLSVYGDNNGAIDLAINLNQDIVFSYVSASLPSVANSSAVPEPSSLVLIGLSFIGMTSIKRCKAKS